MPITSIQCQSIDEAARVLADNPRARLLAGGTLVMRALNEADPSIDTVVRVLDPGLRALQLRGDTLHLGAAVTMSMILSQRDCAFLHPVARGVGGPAIRNMATVGGNLFAASPYGDFTVALLALDARVQLAGGEEQPLQSFLQHRGRAYGGHARGAGAVLVTGLVCQRPALPEAFRFAKVSRVKPKGLSVMSLAAHLPRQGTSLQDVRIAYGAMADTPVRVTGVEQALEGRALDAATIDAAVAQAATGLQPPSDAIASSWYRQSVVPVHLRRLLTSKPTGPNR